MYPSQPYCHRLILPHTLCLHFPAMYVTATINMFFCSYSTYPCNSNPMSIPSKLFCMYHVYAIIIHFISQRLSCHSRTLYNLKQEQTNNKTIKIKSASKNSMATTV